MIHHNVVEYTSSSCIYVDGYADGVSNIEVYNNIVHHSGPSPYGMGIGVSSEKGGLTQNINVHDNWASHNSDVGINYCSWSEPGYTSNCRNVAFRNNKACNNGWLNFNRLEFAAVNEGNTVPSNCAIPIIPSDCLAVTLTITLN